MTFFWWSVLHHAYHNRGKNKQKKKLASAFLDMIFLRTAHNSFALFYTKPSGCISPSDHIAHQKNEFQIYILGALLMDLAVILIEIGKPFEMTNPWKLEEFREKTLPEWSGGTVMILAFLTMFQLLEIPLGTSYMDRFYVDYFLETLTILLLVLNFSTLYLNSRKRSNPQRAFQNAAIMFRTFLTKFFSINICAEIIIISILAIFLWCYGWTPEAM